MSYKTSECKGTVSSVDDAINTLRDELGAECREIVDNASEGLQQTQRIQTLGDTADTLEGLSDVNLPEALADLVITYHEAVPARKGRSPSRSTRCSNACAVLSAAEGVVQAWIDDNAEADSELLSDAETLVQELGDIVSNAEGCEFPGMFG